MQATIITVAASYKALIRPNKDLPKMPSLQDVRRCLTNPFEKMNLKESFYCLVSVMQFNDTAIQSLSDDDKTAVQTCFNILSNIKEKHPIIFNDIFSHSVKMSPPLKDTVL